MSNFSQSEQAYVQVAIPVPLRQSFTYKVDQHELEGYPEAGVRVAVPFGRRKLAGFVLGPTTEALDDRVRYKKVAAVLDPEPVFHEELLCFLKQAAEYYMHPIGEVLRSAAPAISSDAVRRLKTTGFLGDDDRFSEKTMSTRRVWKLQAINDNSSGTINRLGPKQQLALNVLGKRQEIEWDELREMVGLTKSSLLAMVDKGVVQLREVDAGNDSFVGPDAESDHVVALNPEQQKAVNTLMADVRAAKAGEYLLHGVTGSGKTEVYMRAIAQVLEQKRGAVVLVPEIALTPQLVSRFRARFGSNIAVLHSGLSARERHDAWRRLRSGRTLLAIGARSAVFAPVRNIGIIVVDEEHDSSFKQEEGFRYNARDMAVMRARLAKSMCVLGSATPSLESYWKCANSRFTLLELPSRATSHTLPDVKIVDLGKHSPGPSGHYLVTHVLHEAIEKCLADQNQAILFLNRRGFSSVRCGSCAQVVQCPACSVALTSHRGIERLRCHYCDYSTHLKAPCPSCKSTALESVGAGTERVQDVIAQAFPTARVARLDRDTAGRVGGVEKLLDRMRAREIDILIGTQMVTKGHDLPEVTLVGVLLADQPLMFPDFRAAERTFQLLAQVAGRAGRGERPGRVIVQSYQPEHPSVIRACKHDYANFYADEIRVRQQATYPPYSFLAAVRMDAGEESIARQTGETLARVARHHATNRVQVLGPAPAPLARLRGRYRFRLLLRASKRVELRRVLAVLQHEIDKGLAPARASIDIDPVSML